jgi:hypothetical protein
VCFRADGDDARQTAIAQAMAAGGFACAEHDRGRRPRGAAAVHHHPRTTFADVERTLEHDGGD